MAVGYLIASSGDYRFPTDQVMAALVREYPVTSITAVSFPGPRSQLRASTRCVAPHCVRSGPG